MDRVVGLMWGVQFQNLHMDPVWKLFTQIVRMFMGAYGDAQNSVFVKDILQKLSILRYPKERVQNEA